MHPLNSSSSSALSSLSSSYVDQGFYEKRIKTKGSNGRTIILTTIMRIGREKNTSEAYRTALHAFLERRKNPSDPGFIISPNSPDKARLDYFVKNSNDNTTIKINNNNGECNITVSRLPNADPSEIFEIGSVAGTEDRYIDLIYAEWRNSKVCLRRYTHPDCKSAVKADLDILGEIRHPNLLLLMGITQTDDYGLVAVYEPVDCTLFNYIHEQGEHVSVQGIAKCAGNLAAALKHAHMLGYIHSAISSHCVFLGPSGVVKLGGWELATEVNKPKRVRNYEERLRTEIFRWQAPELFTGNLASTATDVYGVTLLMWEMCTMSIPWSGLSIEEVKKQYVQCKRGVTIDIYNFPSLLNNLLEAGLQLDVAKRTLDMIKLNRFLQRLEMQYEDEEPIYIQKVTNNNHHQKSTSITSIDTSSCYTNPVVTNCCLTSATSQYTKKLISDTNVRAATQEHKIRSHEILSENQKNYMRTVDNIFQTKSHGGNDFINTDITQNEISVEEPKYSKSISDFNSNINTTNNQTNEDIDYIDDSRLSIKKLKETLATKREHFFYGDSSLDNPSLTTSTIDNNEVLKTSIISQVRSKDYEPHKPASHKTCLQPKQNISSQHSTDIPKKTYKKNQRAPYSYVPTPIRNAVIQPQILNEDSQSFFETSLWRKEKLISLSKMGHNNSENNIELEKNTSPASDKTFTYDHNISMDNSEDISEHFAPINDSSVNITASTIPRSKSMQALKDALERATDIISSTTPVIPISSGTSLVKSPKKEFNEIIDNSSENRSIFEESYELNEETQSESEPIERSATGDTFTVNCKQTNYNDEDELLQRVNNHMPHIGCKNEISSIIHPIATVRKFQGPSIVEYSNKRELFKISNQDTKKTSIHPSGIDNTRCISQNEIRGQSSKQFTLFTSNDPTAKDMECLSCSHGTLIRRRSLPASLGQLKISNYKLPIKKGDLPDATVEDLYIDDEFGESSLAPNMILMNEETVTDEENYFPDLLDTPKPVYS